MSRSKFIWLIIFETGKSQPVKAQTLYQIINCGKLIEDPDSIISATKIESCNSYSYKDALDIPFEN